MDVFRGKGSLNQLRKRATIVCIDDVAEASAVASIKHSAYANTKRLPSQLQVTVV